jgi:hypothetical protein
MAENAVFFRKADTYRVMIDNDGTGHIRIIKRMNFRMILTLFKELYLEIRKTPGRSPHIIIHVSQSLYDEMSENLKEFLLFCSACLDGTFELAVVE